LTKINGIPFSKMQILIQETKSFITSAKSKKLSTRSILKAVDDEGVLKQCVLGLRHCSQKNPCPMHAEFREIRDQLTNLFDNKTIGDLADKMNESRTFINNSGK
jgi:DNA-binding IscR family transcriptional regulator